jgi:hypothetical protein
VWVDLLTPREFEAGFGSHTPMYSGQTKCVRYYMNFSRAMELAKECLLEVRGTLLLHAKLYAYVHVFAFYGCLNIYCKVCALLNELYESNGAGERMPARGASPHVDVYAYAHVFACCECLKICQQSVCATT